MRASQLNKNKLGGQDDLKTQRAGGGRVGEDEKRGAVRGRRGMDEARHREEG